MLSKYRLPTLQQLMAIEKSQKHRSSVWLHFGQASEAFMQAIADEFNTNLVDVQSYYSNYVYCMQPSCLQRQIVHPKKGGTTPLSDHMQAQHKIRARDESMHSSNKKQKLFDVNNPPPWTMNYSDNGIDVDSLQKINELESEFFIEVLLECMTHFLPT
jgi:hypothetical protein